MADYQLPYSGDQIKSAIGAALNPDQQVTPNSNALITSGAVDAVASQQQAAINTKADTSALNALSAVVDTKADESDLSALETVVDGKADESDLTALETVVAGKQDALTFDNVPTKDSANPVKSGGVFSSEEALKQMILASFPTDTITDVPVASFPDGADGVPVKSLTVNITPVQTAGTPTPDAPLPISGWTGANVGVDGANDLDQTFELGTINSQGVPVASSGNMRSVYFSPVEPSTQYVILNKGRKNFRFFFYKADESFRYRSNSVDNKILRFSTGPDDRYIKIVFAGTEYDGNFVLCKADDVAAYSVSWESEAGTIWGGTLRDNGNGTWTLTVTHGIVDLGELSWSKNASYANKFFYARVPEWVKAYTTVTSAQVNSKSKTLCECYGHYEPVEGNYNYYNNIQDGTYVAASAGLSNDNAVYCRNDAYKDSTSADFKTAMEGKHVVLERATPQTYTLTAESVKTLLGQNNIFADVGNIASLVYRADVGLYIAKKLG